ncbi:phosphatase [Puttea exsequens]|nr:phosphatase [Puttea exsequens]
MVNPPKTKILPCLTLTKDWMNEIIPNLYLGNIYAAQNFEELSAKRISVILTIRIKNLPPATCERYAQKNIQHRFISKRDVYDEDLLDIFRNTSNIIRRSLANGTPVLVHCDAGVSRSSTVVCAYLMQSHGMSSKQAIDFVQSKRSVVRPHLGFEKQLRIWGKCEFNMYQDGDIQNAGGVPAVKEDYKQWLRISHRLSWSEKALEDAKEERSRAWEAFEKLAGPGNNRYVTGLKNARAICTKMAEMDGIAAGEGDPIQWLSIRCRLGDSTAAKMVAYSRDRAVWEAFEAFIRSD